jgi:hypothetical protein
VLSGEGREVMRRIALVLGVILIVVGAVGVLDALGLVSVSICGLFWAAVWIGLGVWIVWGALAREPSTELEEASIPLEGATSARVSISHGAGRLEIGGGAEPGALVQGTFAGGLIHDVTRQGEVLDVKMRVRGEGMLMVLLPWKWARFRGAGWIMRTTEAVPLTLKIEGGASENLLDLADLQVKELEIETGASSTRLTLPARAGHTRASVACGAGAVDVRVPSGVAARVRVQSTLAEVKVDRRRFPMSSGGAYESPDYETAANKVDLVVDANLGSADVH